MIVFNIKMIRQQKNITIYKLAKLTGLSRTYIRNIENNIEVNPSIAVLYKIAEALNVNIKDLFYTKLDIDTLKESLYNSIDNTGINSKETLEISNIIDLLVNIKLKEELDKNI